MARCWAGGRVTPRKGPHHIELTAADDGVSHRVTETAYREGLASGAGHYQALCGRRVLVASMITAPGRACRSCRDAVRSNA